MSAIQRWREYVHEFQRRCDSGVAVKLRLDAGGHRARRGRFHQHRDTVRESGFHGSFFEFLRNSALDARNYFDHPSIADPGRIPPFRRNEFGFTNGGPVVLPNVYDGRDRTFYFCAVSGIQAGAGNDPGFGCTNRSRASGSDIVKYPDGSTDTLQVRWIRQLLRSWPAIHSPTTNRSVWCANLCCAFKREHGHGSVFHPHRSESWRKRTIVWSIQLRQSDGTDNNPDQTLLDPSFGVQYVDRQRNGVITYTRTVSPHFLWSTSLSFTRTTPSFVTPNHTDPPSSSTMVCMRRTTARRAR